MSVTLKNIHRRYMNASGQHWYENRTWVDNIDDFYNMYDGCFFE